MSADEVCLVGESSNPFVIRARIALKLKSVVDYEHIICGSNSQVVSVLNPLQKKLPILIHHGNSIVDSLLMLEYIDEVWSSGPSILPANSYDRFVARYWAHYLDEQWFGSLKSVIDDEEAKASKGAARGGGEKTSKACIDKVVTGVVLMEDKICSNGKHFFGGDEIGYLDIVFGCFLGYISSTEAFRNLKLIDAAMTPGLYQWAPRFCSHWAVKGILIPQPNMPTFS